MNKNELIIILFIGLFLLSGCAALAPGVGFPTYDKEYSCFVGKRYEVISPLKIVVWKDTWGSYWLTYPADTANDKKIEATLPQGVRYVTMENSTNFIADVPVGSIIVVDHVSKRGGYWFYDEQTSFIGKLETPGIFNGGFNLSSLIEWKNYDQKAPFCERFGGLNKKYLKELK